jgi:catechol 2,3-dioxygenase-like lactoylglutathione lyase family enzyme
MLKPTGLIRGHYECRSFEQTIPILSDVLALEVIGDEDGTKILKHPNTGWRLMVHENGPDAPLKPMRNHYGVRVTTNAEVDQATEYLERKRDEFGIKIIKPRENHNAYSVHFYEPGGNYWEIESYENAVETGLGKTTNPHWNQSLPRERFFGKGYVPQALTHGTLENEDIQASEGFYRDVLGLEVVKLWPSSCYVKHPATPWYVVCLQALKQNRQHLSRYQRFTLAIESTDRVHETHRFFEANRRAWQINHLEPLEESPAGTFFLFSDLNGNWWEITSAQQ